MLKKNVTALLLSLIPALPLPSLLAGAMCVPMCVLMYVPMCVQPAVAAAGAASTPSILIYGDSLSAAYGIRQSAGWAALLQERLKQNKFNYSVVNASVSGETTAGGAARIAATMRDARPAVLVLALGANDGLRGLPVAQLRNNLAAIIKTAKAGNSKIVLVGMKMPPNYGPQYTEQFQHSFADLAREQHLTLVPFLLDGVTQRPELFQQDQLHPTEEAQQIILENIWKALKPLLKK